MNSRWLSFCLLLCLLAVGCNSPDAPSAGQTQNGSDTSNTAPGATADTDTSPSTASREDDWRVVDSLPESVRRARIDRIVRAGRDLGGSEPEIRRRYGPPDSTRERVKDTPYGTQIRRLTLMYPGVTFQLAEVIGEDKSLNRGPTVRGADVLRDTLVQIGDLRLDVRKTFGEATTRASLTDSTSEIEYETMGMEATDYVIFRFTNERLTEIEWEFWAE